MPRYDLEIHRSAERELNALDADTRDRLTDVLVEVAETREPTSHPSARALEGQDGLFRIRVGEHRAVLELCKPSVMILTCGHRSNVYDAIDEIDDRRATA